LLQVPDVVIHLPAYDTAARVRSGNTPNIPLTVFADMKETAIFEGRSEE